MRAMPIRIISSSRGVVQLKASFKKNYLHYLQEALGLGLFMVSACFFGAMLFSPQSPWFDLLPGNNYRQLIMGPAMGCTALLIFYAPFTAPSGAQINPAVTLTFLRLNRMCRYDALFYILFQAAGAILAVALMQRVMGSVLTNPPVNTVVTVPGNAGSAWAAVTELLISFLTMTVILFTDNNKQYKKYTRVIAACLVCTWVIIAGPVSGFGMNPSRTLASAAVSGIWTDLWVYIICPLAGMLLAGEIFLRLQRRETIAASREEQQTSRKKFMEPFEFML